MIENITEYRRNYMKKYRKNNPILLLRKEVHRLFTLNKKLNNHNKTVERQTKWKNVQSRSNHFVIRSLNCGYNGKIHNIHHCYGSDVYSFVIMLKENHIELHNKFGIKNEDCLITNEKVKEFILNKPHILVENGKIIENTMNNM